MTQQNKASRMAYILSHYNCYLLCFHKIVKKKSGINALLQDMPIKSYECYPQNHNRILPPSGTYPNLGGPSMPWLGPLNGGLLPWKPGGGPGGGPQLGGGSSRLGGPQLGSWLGVVVAMESRICFLRPLMSRCMVSICSSYCFHVDSYSRNWSWFGWSVDHGQGTHQHNGPYED